VWAKWLLSENKTHPSLTIVELTEPEMPQMALPNKNTPIFGDSAQIRKDTERNILSDD
jgi:hypothetical protein